LSEGDVRLPKLSCSGRLFHSVSPAVAKQWSPNSLLDLLTRHVRLSADRRGRRTAAVTSNDCMKTKRSVMGLLATGSCTENLPAEIKKTM